MPTEEATYQGSFPNAGLFSQEALQLQPEYGREVLYLTWCGLLIHNSNAADRWNEAMWFIVFKGLTFGLSPPKPPNGIISGVCAHRGCVHSIISYLTCVLPQRSTLTELCFRSQCVFFVGVPRQWGPQWDIPQQAVYGILTLDYKKLASGLMKPSRTSPHITTIPRHSVKSGGPSLKGVALRQPGPRQMTPLWEMAF